MYLCMNINLTLFRQKLYQSGFDEKTIDAIMDKCIDSEAPTEEEDD